MNLDEVNEKECTEALCSFSKSVETEENSSFFQSSSTGGQMFDSPDIVEKTVHSKSDSKIIGGFTCCVPGCASNNKSNRNSRSTTFLTEKVKSQKIFEKHGYIWCLERIFRQHLDIEFVQNTFRWKKTLHESPTYHSTKND